MNLTTNAREDMPLVAGYGQRWTDHEGQDACSNGGRGHGSSCSCSVSAASSGSAYDSVLPDADS
jgi:hypothetical protein